jgi:Mrp family chromosome partitioning ATPase
MEMLTGKVSMENLGVPTSIPHLSLIPSGHAEVPAQALISQPMLGELIKAARQRFELVVIDTPPVLQFPDALHISKVVDGVILVVSPQGTSRRQQQEMRRLLERVEAHIFGTVLNRVRSRAMIGP